MPESLPAELVDLRERLEAFVEEIRPLGAKLDGDTVPDEVRAQVRERSKELGFFGMTQPREDGGSEAPPEGAVEVADDWDQWDGSDDEDEAPSGEG